MSLNYTWKGLNYVNTITDKLSNELTELSVLLPVVYVDHSADVSALMNNIASFAFLNSSIPSPNQFGSALTPNIFSPASLESTKEKLNNEIIILEELLSDIDTLTNVGNNIKVPL
jgi:hypothetical protein